MSYRDPDFPMPSSIYASRPAATHILRKLSVGGSVMSAKDYPMVSRRRRTMSPGKSVGGGNGEATGLEARTPSNSSLRFPSRTLAFSGGYCYFYKINLTEGVTNVCFAP